jgi:hypothetical protein
VHRLLVCMFAMLASSSALARDGHIDCASSDKRAVLLMPSPANKLARVSCTKWGHIIQPVVNWIWTRPGGYRPVFFPAQMVASKPSPVGNNDYFVEIRSRELPVAESLERWKFVDAVVPGPVSSDLRSLEIVAKNRKGQSHIIYLFNSGWGYGCSPKCVKETIFLVVNKDKQKVSW